MSKPTHPALEALKDTAHWLHMAKGWISARGQTELATQLQGAERQACAAIPALEALLAERDELRAALERARTSCTGCQAMREIDAAIAKAEK